MKGILTVLGHDKVGIMAAVCTYLAENGINILDISQTIIQGYFNMMMIVDLTGSGDRFERIAADLAAVGEKIGCEVRLQHEEIFRSMHRI